MCQISIFYECNMIYWNFNSLLPLDEHKEDRNMENVWFHFVAPIFGEHHLSQTECKAYGSFYSYFIFLFILCMMNQIWNIKSYIKYVEMLFLFYCFYERVYCVVVQIVWTYRINCFRRFQLFTFETKRFCRLFIFSKWWR